MLGDTSQVVWPSQPRCFRLPLCKAPLLASATDKFKLWFMATVFPLLSAVEARIPP